jgi:hypothetical protein
MPIDPIIQRVTKSNWDEWRLPLMTLFERSFSRKLSSNYFDWRYVNNQESIFISVAGESEKPIASYSSAPVILTQNQNRLSSIISMTTMTSPEARGLGLFALLGEDVYAHAIDSGVGFVWGFPNRLIHDPRKRKLAWHDIYELPMLTLGLDGHHNSIKESASRVTEDRQFELLYNPINYGGLIRTERTSDFLKWRYLNHPVNKYNNYVIEENGKVLSHIVTKSYLEGIDLVDIQVSCEADATDLLNFVIQKSLREEHKMISCWASVHHFVHGILERLGFENSGPVTYFCGRELIEGASPIGWRGFSNWYIQMGDSDVY